MLSIENWVRRIFRTGTAGDAAGLLPLPWSAGQRLRAKEPVLFQYHLSGGWLEPSQKIALLDISAESCEVGFRIMGGTRAARATFHISDCEKFEPAGWFRG